MVLEGGRRHNYRRIKEGEVLHRLHLKPIVEVVGDGTIDVVATQIGGTIGEVAKTMVVVVVVESTETIISTDVARKPIV